MKRLDSCQASSTQAGHSCYMLTELYVEPLLVDEELADQVWEALGMLGRLTIKWLGWRGG